MSGSFSYKITTETEQLTFEFSPILGSSETITSAVCNIEVKEGTDPTPSTVLLGTPVISGTKVAQRVTGGLDGVIYRLEMSATTSASNVYTIVGDMQVLDPMSV